ncbi:MAG: EAL domain-containing protein [Sideroxyarcus sp.]|nr:EAL domain-containing protein [Sideroxyarcus sp.]
MQTGRLSDRQLLVNGAMNNLASQNFAPHAEPEAQRKQTNPTDSQASFTEELLQELQVHQIELEMQNDELRRAQVAIEESRDRYMDLYDFAPVGYLTLTRDGLIAEANLTSAALLGEDRRKLLNRRFAGFVSACDKDRWYQFFLDVLQTGEKLRCELALQINDEVTFHVQLDCQSSAGTAAPVVRIAMTDISERKKIETEKTKAEANLRAILDNSPYLTWLKDTKGHYVTVNKAFAASFELDDVQQVCGKTDFDFHPRELAEQFRADDAEVLNSRQQKRTEEMGFDGKQRIWVESFKAPVIDANGNVLGSVGFAQDISHRNKIEAELRISAVAFESQEAMIITDPNGVIIRVNRAFTETTGYTPEEAIGQKPSMLKSGQHDANFYRAMWKTIQCTGGWQGEIWDRRKNGEVYPKWLTISAVRDDDGVVTHYVGSHYDITERKRAEDQIRHLAFYDHLTRLPNRRLVSDRLLQALITSGGDGRHGAVMFIDLDNFKTLNDTLGHDIGDLLLQQVARRLQSCVRQGDTVARLGGDEFVILLEGLSAKPLEATAQAEAIGEKILATLNQPYQLEDHVHHNTPSIGITLFSGVTQSSEELFKQADLAMYQAKKAGRNALRFFDAQMQESINANSSIEADLRKAIENNEFKLHYQIQTDVSRRPIGAEALIRWTHPAQGPVSPAKFIPLAEESGLIIPIGRWVLETACLQLKAWQDNELTRDLVLSVNVSARQFRQAGFVAEVQTAIARHNIQANHLKLELTESMLLDKVEETIATMNALKALGVRISLDDFGTGYSSLQYLKRLPIDQLKIDQSFVHDIAVDESDRAIVRTIIAMAHSLDLDVIAEGVEAEEQRQFLEHAGCRHYQGYLLGKPAPIEIFEAALTTGSQDLI